MSNGRSRVQQEVAEALIESKAIDFTKVGEIIAKNGARATIAGEGLVCILGPHVIDLCIPPWERGNNFGEQLKQSGGAE